MSEARDYFLTEEQLRARFEERVRDFVFHGYAPQEQPVLVLVGAQPAAGKSQAMAAAVQRHADRQLVPLTGDELRAFHPQYEELLAEQPLLFPNATGQASGAWVRMSIEHARAHGYSLMLEGVFRNPEMTVATAEEFAAAHYVVEVLGLGVRAERSRLDSLHRYLESGRWTPPTAHDSAYEKMPQTIAAAEASPAVRRLTITDRTGADLYANERNPDGHWRHEPAGVAALEASRARPLPPGEAAGWLARHRDILVEFAARGQIVETTLPVLRAVTRDADAVAAMDPDPRGAVRREYAALRPLVHALVSRPVTSTGALPLPLLPVEALTSRPHRDAALVATELARRADLAPAERRAQEAFRRRLHDQIRSPAPGSEAPSHSRPSTAAARSRSTTIRAADGRNRPAAPGGEQPSHLRRSGPDQARGRGPQE
ncbi:zeta toxin family protein [Streptomyces sp. NPDC053367]|uniref:zeta toxin family protein n=1 Tax=Streptomyces sp. NPDC053367 TaxID=3365700 RepID=UPI0037D8E831